jgi:hypothetical protein
MKRIYIYLLVSLICISNLLSQPPQSFNYQTVVRNSKGDIIANKAVAFRISILKGNVTGEAVYVETQLPTTNAFGLVNLEVGKGTLVSGSIININWGIDNYYFQTEIDTTGNTNYVLMGTTQLLSVPYALYAEKSGVSETPGPIGPTGATGPSGGPQGATGPTGIANIKIYGVAGNGVTGLTETYKLIPKLKLTITLSDSATVNVSTNGGLFITFNNHSNNDFSATIGLFLNSVIVPTAFQTIENSTNGVWGTSQFTSYVNWSFATILNLAAGTYTFDVRGKSDVNSFAGANNNSQSSLIVQVFYK